MSTRGGTGAVQEDSSKKHNIGGSSKRMAGGVKWVRKVGELEKTSLLTFAISMKHKRLFFAVLLMISAGLSAQPAMAVIKNGTFLLGDTVGDADEKPLHWVVINSFMIAKTETTYQDFKTFIDSSGYLTDAERGDGSFVWDSLGWHKREGVHWRHDERGRLRVQTRGEYRRYPVSHVSWNDAAHYCNWLSEKAGLDAVYYFEGNKVRVDLSANGYRLPTEAEWEFVAAGEKSKKSWPHAGIGKLGNIGWYSGNSGHSPKPVGLKQAILTDIYDLSGNVWEWSHDWYDANFYKKSQNATNPSGPDTGKERSLRGGSWNNNVAHCRIANRTSRFPDFRDGSIGFRVARPANL